MKYALAFSLAIATAYPAFANNRIVINTPNDVPRTSSEVSPSGNRIDGARRASNGIDTNYRDIDSFNDRGGSQRRR